MELSEIPTAPWPWSPDRETVAGRWQKDRDFYFADKTVPTSDTPMVVIAFDPGGTTGWSVMETTYGGLNDQTKSLHEVVTKWWHGQIVSNDEKIDNYEQVATATMDEIILTAAHERGCDFAVVIESYQIRSKRTDAETISPIRFIAALEHLVWEHNRYLAKQQPSEKSIASDDRLESWGFYAPDGLQHARDADRHALIFLRKLRSKKSLQRRHFPMLQL